MMHADCERRRPVKQATAMVLGIVLCGCAPPPPAVPIAAPPPIALDPATPSECALIRRQIADQQRTAALGSVMATPLVEASVQINAYNVIEGLRARAAIIGCV